MPPQGPQAERASSRKKRGSERERERGAERCREAEISVNGLLLNIVKEEIVGRD